MHNGELSEMPAGCHACMARPMGFALERFVRPRESARGRTNRASANAQLAVRARAARPYVLISGGWQAVRCICWLGPVACHGRLFRQRMVQLEHINGTTPGIPIIALPILGPGFSICASLQVKPVVGLRINHQFKG